MNASVSSGECGTPGRRRRSRGRTGRRSWRSVHRRGWTTSAMTWFTAAATSSTSTPTVTLTMSFRPSSGRRCHAPDRRRCRRLVGAGAVAAAQSSTGGRGCRRWPHRRWRPTPSRRCCPSTRRPRECQQCDERDGAEPPNGACACHAGPTPACVASVPEPESAFVGDGGVHLGDARLAVAEELDGDGRDRDEHDDDGGDLDVVLHRRRSRRGSSRAW